MSNTYLIKKMSRTFKKRKNLHMFFITTVRTALIPVAINMWPPLPWSRWLCSPEHQAQGVTQRYCMSTSTFLPRIEENTNSPSWNRSGTAWPRRLYHVYLTLHLSAWTSLHTLSSLYPLLLILSTLYIFPSFLPSPPSSPLLSPSCAWPLFLRNLLLKFLLVSCVYL